MGGDEPDDLAALSEQCTRHYLEAPDTGVCVCVVDGAITNLRTSKAIRMVQEARKELRQYTIGVFAKADRAGDRDWEDEEQAENEMWRLEARLRGEHDAAGYPQLLFFKGWLLCVLC